MKSKRPLARTRADKRTAGSQQRVVSLLTNGIAAAEGAQVIVELYFEQQDREPSNNDNYCRLMDWLKAARRHRDKQANSEIRQAGPETHDKQKQRLTRCELARILSHMKTMTHRQAERQRVRKQGRYSKMLVCYACKKSIKGELYSHVSDDKNLQAAAVRAGLPEVCIICHECAGRLA